MDLFLASCQALGVGLAVGVLSGAVLRSTAPAALLALAAVAGGALGALSMSADDESVLLGALIGLAGGVVAALAAGGLVAGAVRRAGEGSAAIPALVALAAGLLAGLSILLPPVSLVALAALLWLASARRRRDERKHEGLRVLR
jgi:hypothetical protein